MRIDIVTLFRNCATVSSRPAFWAARAPKTCLRRTATRSATIRRTNKSRPTTTPTRRLRHGAVRAAHRRLPARRAGQCAAQGRAKPHVVFLTAAGRPYTEADARRLAQYDAVTLVCGHYEGIDERVIEAFGDEEISIGDYVH